MVGEGGEGQRNRVAIQGRHGKQYWRLEKLVLDGNKGLEHLAEPDLDSLGNGCQLLNISSTGTFCPHP